MDLKITIIFDSNVEKKALREIAEETGIAITEAAILKASYAIIERIEERERKNQN